MLTASIMIGRAINQENTKTEAKKLQRQDLEVIVKYKYDQNSTEVYNTVKSKYGVKSKKTLKHSKIDILELDKLENVEKIIAELKENQNVEFVQPNYKLDIKTLPDDDKFTEQWGLSNSGSKIMDKTGTPGIDINAIMAWNISTGSNTTVVGVLDTGLDKSHYDLKENIFTNPNEITGNGKDDDKNGYIDDKNGWDFFNKDNMQG
jgi:hypothetical protein